MDAVRWYEGDYAPPAFLKQFSADDPSPQADATDVPRDVVLSWNAGPVRGYAQCLLRHHL